MELLYCFDSNDLSCSENDTFAIQAEYADKLGRLLVIDAQSEWHSMNSDLFEKTVFLRCSCHQYKRDIELLQSHGASLFENEQDILQIESWYRNGFCRRKIRDAGFSDFDDPIVSFPELSGQTLCFIKSVTKGFSAIVSTKRLFLRDKEWLDFIWQQADNCYNKFIISEYVPILSDSVGKMEYRHFVINNKIVNSSRCIRALHHIVPKLRKEYAQSIVSIIGNDKSFPSNYVLDTAVFVDRYGNMFDDVVEINPITTSICYINNSIFLSPIDSIKEIAKSVSYGAEYCFDSIKHPQRYDIMRKPGKDYCYCSDQFYSFI